MKQRKPGSFRLQQRRKRAFDHQNGRCFWCGWKMLWLIQVFGKQNHPLLCTAEHLTPRSKDGNDAPSNIVAACYRCNSARKNKSLEIWLPINKRRLKKMGNHQHYDVILSWLRERGIDLAQAGHPRKSPGQQNPAESPPLLDPGPAP